MLTGAGIPDADRPAVAQAGILTRCMQPAFSFRLRLALMVGAVMMCLYNNSTFPEIVLVELNCFILKLCLI